MTYTVHTQLELCILCIVFTQDTAWDKKLSDHFESFSKAYQYLGIEDVLRQDCLHTQCLLYILTSGLQSPKAGHVPIGVT